MLPPVPEDKRVLHPPAVQGDAATLAAGGRLYGQYCARCHGQDAQGNGVLPDLRYSTYLNNFSWYDIVVRGAMQRTGMVSFGNMITRDDATAIREYVISQANKAKQAMDSGE
jgi:alcohol dehydrogenase (cytochrome c)/quinohemoprotein ethanol dehydrogenase